MLRLCITPLSLLIPMVLAASVIIFDLRLGTGDPALDYLRLSNLPPTPEMLASTRIYAGAGSAAVRPVAAPGCGRRCILTLVSHSPANAGAGRYAEFPAHAGTCRAALVLTAHLRTTSVSGGAIAIVCRISPSVSSRFSACRCLTGWRFLLVMAFSVYLQWLPAMGYGGWQHIILPAVSIAFMSLAINARCCAPVWTSPVSVTSPGQ